MTRISPAAAAARWHYRVSTPSVSTNATIRVPPSWLQRTPFEVEPLNFATLAPPDREAVLAFARQTGELQRAALGSLEALREGLNQLGSIKRIIEQTPTLDPSLRQKARSLELKLLDVRERFTGDPTRRCATSPPRSA